MQYNLLYVCGQRFKRGINIKLVVPGQAFQH